MQKRTKLQQRLLLAGCATAMFASTGCRSGMPSWNMFGSRNQPSAEMLAGNGPSTTYPAPPSESATPHAIASVAGGTQGDSPTTSIASADTPISKGAPDDPVTGFDVAASNSSAAGANLAAARANGFDVASTSGASNYASQASASSTSNASVPAIPAGYKYGTRAESPVASTAGGSDTNDSYVMPSSYPGATPPGGSASPPSAYGLPTGGPASESVATGSTSGFAMPGSGNESPSSPPAGATGGGFTLPDSMADVGGAVNSKPFTPKSSSSATSELATAVSNASSTAGTESAESTVPAPGASSPSFSTASADLTAEPDASLPSSGGGYAPGSTSGSSAYPTTSGYPSTGTGGSYYR
ncbi:hypothetical protein FYK55_06725 [Roseiconus nitratireducens]|uniref:Lipoprotein n=1 Tax=Roseiconus nitratireducens TaxID=2605748 RepID=A0A5M6DCT4_9BACT|nr:hypothetical protein [Roseiconus nitratireducens]KAA5545344.1 hypothetical protein FYK55_06725 [Roseiconus nitratireducens]